MNAIDRPTTRRARNQHDKRTRIFAAAAELFAERGFDDVTTQEVSDRADVANGTLFRYAANKGELLLMVYNEEFGRAIHAGSERAAGLTDRTAAVLAAIEPVLAAGRHNAPNTAAYQRELLFGSPDAPYRAVGLSLVRDLESAVADILTGHVGVRDPAHNESSAASARLAARSVFAVLHHTLVQPPAGTHPEHDPDADARAQVAQIVRGCLANEQQTPST